MHTWLFTCLLSCSTSSSDRVCGVRACLHRHGACSSACIRGSSTCLLSCSTSSSDRVCGARTCRHRHGACSSACIRGSSTCLLSCSTSSSDRVCGARTCRHRHGACSSACIRGSSTCLLSCSTSSSDRACGDLSTEYEVPVLGVTFSAPSPIVHVAPDSYSDEGKSPKRAKKSDASGRITTMTTTFSTQRRPRWPTTSGPSCVRRCAPGSLHNSAFTAILCFCQIDPDSASCVAKARKNWDGPRHARRARADSSH